MHGSYGVHGWDVGVWFTSATRSIAVFMSSLMDVTWLWSSIKPRIEHSDVRGCRMASAALSTTRPG